MGRSSSTDSVKFAKSPSHCSDTALFADKSPWKAVNVDQTSAECLKMVCLFQMRAERGKQVNGQTGAGGCSDEQVLQRSSCVLRAVLLTVRPNMSIKGREDEKQRCI